MTVTIRIRKDGNYKASFRPSLNNNAVTKRVFKTADQLVKYVRWCQRSEHKPSA